MKCEPYANNPHIDPDAGQWYRAILKAGRPAATSDDTYTFWVCRELTVAEAADAAVEYVCCGLLPTETPRSALVSVDPCEPPPWAADKQPTTLTCG